LIGVPMREKHESYTADVFLSCGSLRTSWASGVDRSIPAHQIDP
jgi:hypothetical protein